MPVSRAPLPAADVLSVAVDTEDLLDAVREPWRRPTEISGVQGHWASTARPLHRKLNQLGLH
jgi:hypothetical protein